MKPLTLASVNRAIRSLRVSTREHFYESAEAPYRFGVLDALDAEPRSPAMTTASYVLHTTVPPLVEFRNGTPPVGVVIDRVNEALRREGYIDG